MTAAEKKPRPRRCATVDGGTLRDSLRTTLPGRVKAAVAAYTTFAARPPPDDAKGFAAHHAACKAALAHAEMLVRLLRWAEGAATDSSGAGEEPPADGLEDLLNRARLAVGETDSEEETTEDDPDP